MCTEVQINENILFKDKDLGKDFEEKIERDSSVFNHAPPLIHLSGHLCTKQCNYTEPNRSVDLGRSMYCTQKKDTYDNIFFFHKTTKKLLCTGQVMGGVLPCMIRRAEHVETCARVA